MNELKLIRTYSEGRYHGYLPNSPELDKFVIERIMNDTDQFACWVKIFHTYSKVGILEKCFQMNSKSFSRGDVHNLLLIDEKSRKTTFRRLYGKYLKNKRSKW